MGERGSDGEWWESSSRNGHLGDRPSVIPVGKQWSVVTFGGFALKEGGGAPAPRR